MIFLLMTIGSTLLATATSQLDGPGEMEHAMLLFSSSRRRSKGGGCDAGAENIHRQPVLTPRSYITPPNDD